MAGGGSCTFLLSFVAVTIKLLVFFILMINFAEVNESKMQDTLMVIMQTMGADSGGVTLSKGKLAEMGMTFASLPSRQQGSQLSKSLREAQAFLEPEIKTKKVLVREDERGLIISLVGDMFFEPGDAMLLPEAKAVLDKVGKLINTMKDTMGMDNRVEVEGFADSGQIPVSSPYYAKFPTNLDLAFARSSNTIKYLWASGVGPNRTYKGKLYAKLKGSSYGEFQPMEDNTSPEKRAYNRRVDIVIVRDDESNF